MPLDDVLVIIRQVLHVKTQNLAMQAHVKNMEALLQANHVAVPLQGKNQAPEATPVVEESKHVPDNYDLLSAIDDLERKEKKSFLENSMKPGGFGNSLF